jgi:hypothetical protein
VSGTLGDVALDRSAAEAATGVAETGISRTERLTSSSGDRRVYLERHAPPTTLVVIGDHLGAWGNVHLTALEP